VADPLLRAGIEPPAYVWDGAAADDSAGLRVG